MTFDRVRFVALAVLLLAVAGGSLSAHHSAAMFDDKEAAARGTITEVVWRNPHVVLKWDVKDDKGQVVHWIGDLASVSSLVADGFNRDSVKSGDEVIIVYRPAKAGNPEGVIGAILKPDGKMVLPWSRRGFGGAPESVQGTRTEDRVKLLAPFGIKVVQ